MVIYRPGSARATDGFFDEMADLLARTATYAAPLLILGDMEGSGKGGKREGKGRRGMEAEGPPLLFKQIELWLWAYDTSAFHA